MVVAHCWFEAEQRLPFVQKEEIKNAIGGRGHGRIDLPTVTKYFVINISAQKIYVDDGDWIITEPDHIHHYPCKPDIFESKYEWVEDVPKNAEPKAP